MRTLQPRGYIDEVGRDPGPGQAVLYGTTADVPRRLGLDSLADLPPLAEFVPGAEVVEALEVGLRVDASTDARRPEPTALGAADGRPRAEGERLQKVLARAGLGQPARRARS